MPNPVVHFEATLEELQRLGGTVRMPLTRVPGGPTMAMFADPEGNLIGLLQPETKSAAPPSARAEEAPEPLPEDA